MNFEQAWSEMCSRGIDKKEGTPIIRIEFLNSVDGEGFATLTAPKFHKDKDKTKEDVLLAWNTFCRPQKEREESITKIEIIHEKSA